MIDHVAREVDQTIAVTFGHLESVLSRALEISPVLDPIELPKLIPPCSVPAQSLILAELIKLDMIAAANGGQYRKLQFYESLLASHFDNRPPLDLVLEEIHVMRTFGERPEIEDFQKRFPHLSSVLSDLITRPVQTTRPHPIEKVPRFEDGSRIDDFLIMRMLGRGGFASVYLAKQLSMQRLVALKVSQFGTDEPIMLSQLDHPNIVRVFDQRSILSPNVNLLYMQYVPGGTLADVIERTEGRSLEVLSGRDVLIAIDEALLAAAQQAPESGSIRQQLSELDWPRVVAWIGIQLAEGLAAAHAQKVMHRDVKPANILLSAEGVPKLADFNISFCGQAGSAGASVHFGGSLAYMSPEQLSAVDPLSKTRPEDLDVRSDLYSLGIVLWELWQGCRPTSVEDVASNWHNAIVQQIESRKSEHRVLRPSSTASSRVLEKALLQTLEFDREARPRSAQEFAGKLRLAMSEAAAEFFEPQEKSIYWRLRQWPVLATTSFVIFLPNVIAGFLNYQYNLTTTIRTSFPQFESKFVMVSALVNGLAFPFGFALLIYFLSPVARAFHKLRQNIPASEEELDAAWNLAHRAAMIGGMLWVIAGLAFPLLLRWVEPSFGSINGVKFFLSLAICGGIAWIYPFFGIALLATEVYYPALVSPTMVDSHFVARSDQLRYRASIYLGSAAVIPLLAVALISVSHSTMDSNSRIFLLLLTSLTGVGLLFAFRAHQRLHRTIAQLKSVLGS